MKRLRYNLLLTAEIVSLLFFINEIVASIWISILSIYEMIGKNYWFALLLVFSIIISFVYFEFYRQTVLAKEEALTKNDTIHPILAIILLILELPVGILIYISNDKKILDSKLKSNRETTKKVTK